ncbi:hypothetical protein JOC93_003380 [Priestia taiwanensis]|uniref:Uncharacterized protein n=1 Tax=Priestia taiwanensis TaxID=1347902 RepID=A0A917AW11_9BACI|nr:hypothetical protein [Priestia taiwanensis]GGE79131.1 hypothetical protein GCM10007140_30880 [Priestia taiwanensis]
MVFVLFVYEEGWYHEIFRPFSLAGVWVKGFFVVFSSKHIEGGMKNGSAYAADSAKAGNWCDVVN